MGTGASAGAAGELVQGASPEELQKILDALSPDDRAKLQGAMAQADAPAEGGAAAATSEAAAETEAPAEAKEAAEATAEAAVAPAEGAAEGDKDAPFLAEYFAKVQSRTAALISDQEKLLALAVDPEANKKLNEESKAWFESEAKPLLEKSFKRHDINNSDVLDPKEADLLFKHMVREETNFAQAISALSIEAGARMSMGMLKLVSIEEREKIKPLLEEQIKKKIESAMAEVQKKEDNYKANKADFDAAAFKVLDTNADGTLQLVEFLAAFEPHTSKNMEMYMALGYVTKEEFEEQKKREEQATEQAGECAQQ